MGWEQERHSGRAVRLLVKHRVHMTSIFRWRGSIEDCLAACHLCCRVGAVGVGSVPSSFGLGVLEVTEEDQADQPLRAQPMHAPRCFCHQPHVRHWCQLIREKQVLKEVRGRVSTRGADRSAYGGKQASRGEPGCGPAPVRSGQFELKTAFS